MIQLSHAAFLDLARRFASAEAFARFLIDNKLSLRAEREARRAARAGVQSGQVESGLRVASRTQPDTVAPDIATRPASAEGLEHPRVKLAVARKAVPLLEVTPNARQVLAALLDFCNGETLRCFPGLDHIALKLGRSGQKDPRRHIRRGIADLVAAGVLKVAAHAGLRHANAYFPQWERLAAIVAAFEAGEGMAAGRGAGDRVRVQSDSPDRIVLQTQKKIPTSVEVKRVQRARSREPDRAQRQLPLVSVVKAAPVPAAIAREQAMRRLGEAYRARLHELGEAAGRSLRSELTEADWEAGIVAEMARRGSGLTAMLDAGFERWTAETRPPSAAAG